MIFFTLGSLWRSSGERDEEVLIPRNFGYLLILAPCKQTRMVGFVLGKKIVEGLQIVEAGVIGV